MGDAFRTGLAWQSSIDASPKTPEPCESYQEAKHTDGSAGGNRASARLILAGKSHCQFPSCWPCILLMEDAPEALLGFSR